MNSPKILIAIFVLSLFPAPLIAQENLQELASTLNAHLNKNTVAVVGFSCTNGQTQPASSIIQERLITFLANNKNITVVERNKLDTVFNEHALQISGVVDIDSAKSLGKLVAADMIITGSFTYINSKQIEVNARAIDANTGKIVATANATMKKDWQENDSFIKDITKDISQKAAEYFKSGMQYYNQGKYSMAIEFFTRAIAQNTEFASVYIYRGIAYYKKGNYDNAMKDYNKAIEINPELAQAYFQRALSYKFITAEYTRALEDFDKAIELDPNVSAYYTERGELYVFNKEYDKAMADLNKAIILNPNEAEAYAWRGHIFFIKNDIDRAIKDYSKAIELSPLSIGYWIDRADAYWSKKEYKKALNDCNKAIEIDPQRAAEACVMRDAIYKEMNKKH